MRQASATELAKMGKCERQVYLITIGAKIHHLQQHSSSKVIMSMNNLIASFLAEISVALLQQQSLVSTP
jgi:hypothetical protein